MMKRNHKTTSNKEMNYVEQTKKNSTKNTTQEKKSIFSQVARELRVDAETPSENGNGGEEM